MFSNDKVPDVLVVTLQVVLQLDGVAALVGEDQLAFVVVL
jgi:hypothetical protein